MAQQGQKTCVPVKCYDNVVVIDETNVADPEDGTSSSCTRPASAWSASIPARGARTWRASC